MSSEVPLPNASLLSNGTVDALKNLPEQYLVQSNLFSASTCQLQHPTLWALSTSNYSCYYSSFLRSSSFPLVRIFHAWGGVLLCCSFVCLFLKTTNHGLDCWPLGPSWPPLTTTVVYSVPCSTLLSAAAIKHSDQTLRKERDYFTYSW